MRKSTVVVMSAAGVIAVAAAVAVMTATTTTPKVRPAAGAGTTPSSASTVADMPGMDMSGTGRPSAAPSRLVGPAEFAAAIADTKRVTINVHVPDEGSIAQTDLSIPFDEIKARSGELPRVGTPLAVYCRSGRMSAAAVKALAALGYRDVVELRGGMEAWKADGRRLLAAAER